MFNVFGYKDSTTVKRILHNIIVCNYNFNNFVLWYDTVQILYMYIYTYCTLYSIPLLLYYAVHTLYELIHANSCLAADQRESLYQTLDSNFQWKQCPHCNKFQCKSTASSPMVVFQQHIVFMDRTFKDLTGFGLKWIYTVSGVLMCQEQTSPILHRWKPSELRCMEGMSALWMKCSKRAVKKE